MAEIKKERIKDQMLRTAARLWGVPEHEVETNYDPLILLLIEACASELEKIGYDINASQSRLLTRLADLIVPEAVLGASPASCIIQATPIETTAVVDPFTKFYTNQRIQKPQTGAPHNLDVFFTPVGRFPLCKAQLAYTQTGTKLYKGDENGSRDVIAEMETASGQSKEIWLAIEPDKSLKSLKGLSLFFDLRSHSEAAGFYGSLGNIKAWAGDQEILLGKGYSNNEQFELDPAEMLVAGHDQSKKIHRQVAAIYSNRFLFVEDDLQLTPGNIPESWQHQFSPQVLGLLAAKQLIYIRLELGRQFNADVLDGLVCRINALPVVNRRFNTMNYKTDAWVNTIPMQIEGSFLDMQSVTSVTGGNYKFRTSADDTGMEEGEAIVRSSGVGKTNSREVREMIGSLMEGIRDESAYFSEVSNEFILARLKEINQILARLEDQMAKARDNQQGHHYIMLRPKKAGEQLSISYWTTDGPDAHQIKAGTFLNASGHTLTGAKNVVTVTNVTGGKSAMTEAEKKNHLRRQIASNGKIISVEDIKLAAVAVFSDKLKKVQVNKGVQIGNGSSQGFSRTIDVMLTLAPGFEGGQQEVDYLRGELAYMLEQHASPVYPFRVLVNS
jgi:hypothetical protein